MVTSWAQSRNSSKSLEQVATGEARFAAMPVVKTTFVGREGIGNPIDEWRINKKNTVEMLSSLYSIVRSNLINVTKQRFTTTSCATQHQTTRRIFVSIVTGPSSYCLDMDNQQTPEILIVGAGAVGAFYGSRLAAAAARVSCICRSNYDVAKSTGFTIKSPYYGSYQFLPTAVYRTVQEAALSNTFDYVLVATKSLPDFENIPETIAPAIKAPNTAVVLLQNGVGVEQPYRAAFPNNPIISAVEYVSASQNNGLVIHNKWTRICLGNYYSPPRPQGVNAQRDARGIYLAQKLVDIFQAGGVQDAQFWEDISLARWHKVALNAAFNASAILTGGLTNADMVRDPVLRQHLKDVMDEIMTAAPKIIGKTFPRELAPADAILKSTERNEGSKPSMLLDFESGKALEIETILGEPARIARRHGLVLPRTESLYALLRPYNAKLLQKAKF
ncbi:2-dehydropantoate 2-reductase [Synchytrium endobioticum]|uniref:2-dehydropantoate 2-reductase n=1 Tax=Synchytrium endobioticum TaxID=286115 RepID=A0A507CLW3_9FUNG|nr:2-dehydropantoate 2-reductase [Synchytrium endobioticum]